MKTIVLTGATGLLGRYIQRSTPLKPSPEGIVDYKYNVVPLYRDEVDVSNFPDLIQFLFNIQPDIIIHCAANGDVDDVEKNSSKAVRSDLLGTINLKDYCEKMGCKLVTISSNAVYDGERTPYTEYSERHPVNFYGKIKSLADDIIFNSRCDWNIIRPILLYGKHDPTRRGNWVTKVVESLQNGVELSMVTDSYTQPTYAKDVAEFIWKLIEEDSWGNIYNVATPEKCSIYEFGLKIKEVWGLDGVINKAELADFKSIAPRPVDTCFYVGRLESTGFRCKGIKEGLKAMKDEY